jgi:hypothetical protein
MISPDLHFRDVLAFMCSNVFRNNDIPYTSEVTDSNSATEIVHDICVQMVEKIDIMLELQHVLLSFCFL